MSSAEAAREEIIRKYRISTLWMFIVGLVDIVFVLLWARGIPSSAVVIVVGVVTFFGLLAILNFLTDDNKLDKGEMRKAVAASLLIVYFAVLSLVVFGPGADRSEEGIAILESFSTLMAVVVGFYFGGRTAEEVIKAWKDKGDPSDSDTDDAMDDTLAANLS